MKVISDIRIYRSQTENTDGSPHPSGFTNMELSVTIRRIVMKLRENGFTLGGFDHLYINLTTCAVKDGIAPSERSVDRYHPFYRYYDVNVDRTLYDLLETPQCVPEVIEMIRNVLTRFFCTPDFDEQHICSCIAEAVTQGADMLMRFREKQAAKGKAVIYLRLTDSGRYFPLLRVYDTESGLILEKDLPETNSLDAFGDIQLSSKKVTVRPRKNAFTKDTVPMTFML